MLALSVCKEPVSWAECRRASWDPGGMGRAHQGTLGAGDQLEGWLGFRAPVLELWFSSFPQARLAHPGTQAQVGHWTHPHSPEGPNDPGGDGREQRREGQEALRGQGESGGSQRES